MKKYKINESFALAGAFWRFDNPQTVTTGDISSQEGRLKLAAAPTFNRLNSEALVKAFQDFGAKTEAVEIDSLCGHTLEGSLQHHPSTLFARLQITSTRDVATRSWSARSFVPVGLLV
jgi:hypothetical protein